MALASLTVDLTLGLSKFESDSGRAAQILARDQANMARSATTFIAALQKQADQAGKTRTELLSLKATQLGVSEQAAALIAKIDAASKPATAPAGAAAAAVGAGAAAHAMEGFSLATSSARRELIVLGHEAATGNFSRFAGSLSVLAERTGAANLLFSGLGVGVLGAVAAVAAFGAAVVEGASQSRKLADALVLTGNYAGVTEGQFNALAKGVAASGQVSIGVAREFEQALVATGQIGPQVLAAATAAAAKYGQATGQEAKEVAADFASMTKDVVAWATEHNKQLNFLTAAQFDQIKTLQELGRAADAQGVIYEALNARLSKLPANLGAIERALRAGKNAFSAFWDAALDVGRTETVDDKIAKLNEQIAKAQERARHPINLIPNLEFGTDTPTSSDNRGADELIAQRDALQRQKAAGETAAAATAERAAVTQRAITSKTLIDQYAKEGKSVDLYREKLAQLKAAFADNANAGTPVSATKQAAALKGLADSFRDRRGINDADAQRKAQLDQDLKNLRDNLANEQDALVFNQRFVDAIYQSGGVSLKDFYASKQTLIAAGIAAELDALAGEKSRLQRELDGGAFKDQAERSRVQTQLNETAAKTARTGLEATRAATLATLEQAAAEKQLQDRTVDFYAALAEGQGDAQTAELLRMQAQVAAAAAIAKASEGSNVPITQKALDSYSELLQTQKDFADVQRATGITTADASRAEELAGLQALQRGDSLLTQERDIYAIRSKQLVQLQALADASAALAAKYDDPRLKAAAADAALAVAKAAEAVDPALTRLRDSVKSTADSIAGDIGGALEHFQGFPALLESIEKSLLAAGTKFFVTDPLKAGLEGIFRQATEGKSGFAGLLQGAAGVSGGSGVASQTAALATSTATIDTFTAALAQATAQLGGQTVTGGSASTSGGGIFGWLGGLFGGGSAAGGSAAGTVATDDALALYFHTGGLVGSGGVSGRVPASVFAGAARYHSGGIAGLAPNEVPAILKRREEVLTQNDPRHRDNWDGGSSPVVNMTNHFTVEPTTSRNSQNQILAAVGMATQRAVRRNGG